MLRRTADLVRMPRMVRAYEFHRVYHAIHDYCVVDLSAFYYDVLKDRLYTFAPNSVAGVPRRRPCGITSALVRLIAPVLVFTAEEVWKYLPGTAIKSASVHMAIFPVAEKLEIALDEERSKDWERLLAVRDEVLKALEPVRAAKTSFPRDSKRASR